MPSIIEIDKFRSVLVSVATAITQIITAAGFSALNVSGLTPVFIPIITLFSGMITTLYGKTISEMLENKVQKQYAKEIMEHILKYIPESKAVSCSSSNLNRCIKNIKEYNEKCHDHFDIYYYFFFSYCKIFESLGCTRSRIKPPRNIRKSVKSVKLVKKTKSVRVVTHKKEYTVDDVLDSDIELEIKERNENSIKSLLMRIEKTYAHKFDDLNLNLNYKADGTVGFMKKTEVWRVRNALIEYLKADKQKYIDLIQKPQHGGNTKKSIKPRKTKKRKINLEEILL